jgi:hypothetical protein
MSSIYRNYRGENYLAIRKKWEPWYSYTYNFNHDSQQWIDSRKNSISEFLQANKILDCELIIDVGGDRGQYIPDLAKQKIVFDISDKETSGGATRISEFKNLPFADLIIYAHVLEHVKNPIQEILSLFQKSNQIYIEVPYGVPIVNKVRKSKLRFLLHLISSGNPWLWRNKTAPATGRKVNSNKMITQSEHLTFFSEESMEKIASKLSASLKLKRSFISTPDLNEAEVLQCLLTKA